jgi:hypothetical protein
LTSRSQRSSLKEEATLSRQLRTPQFLVTHVPVGYRGQYRGSCHSECMTVTAATPCRTRTTSSAAGPRGEGQGTTKERASRGRLLVCSIHSRFQCGSILDRGVARRSFGLLRHDLWLQIDPSTSATVLVTSGRVRRRCCQRPLPSEPYVILAHHTARAFRSAFRKTRPCRQPCLP